MSPPSSHLSFEFCLRLSPAFILMLHGKHLMRVQQIAEGVSTIPRFMLSPHPGYHRSEQIGVIVYWFCDDPTRAISCFKAEAFPPKKSAAPHLMASMHNWMVRPRSYSTSSTP